jgi:hypothetical protein
MDAYQYISYRGLDKANAYVDQEDVIKPKPMEPIKTDPIPYASHAEIRRAMRSRMQRRIARGWLQGAKKLSVEVTEKPSDPHSNNNNKHNRKEQQWD